MVVAPPKAGRVASPCRVLWPWERALSPPPEGPSRLESAQLLRVCPHPTPLQGAPSADPFNGLSHAKCYSAPWIFSLGLSEPLVRDYRGGVSASTEFIRLEPFWRAPGEVG